MGLHCIDRVDSDHLDIDIDGTIDPLDISRLGSRFPFAMRTAMHGYNAHKHTHTCTLAGVGASVHTHIDVCTYVCVRVRVCGFVCMRVYACV